MIGILVSDKNRTKTEVSDDEDTDSLSLQFNSQNFFNNMSRPSVGLEDNESDDYSNV